MWPIFEDFIILINQVVKLHDAIVETDKKVLENTSERKTGEMRYKFEYKMK